MSDETETDTTGLDEGDDGSPLIFISHKHVDAEVARVVANWIDDVTGGHVAIFLSSDSGRETPEIGADLDQALAENLHRAGVVILVYTSDDHDWSYCTWECGVALNPTVTDTRIICLQCLADTPTILGSTKKVIAGDEESVIDFARMFGDENFYPGLGAALSGQSDERLVQKGRELHDALVEALPDEPLEDWSAWPFLRLEIPLAGINEIRDAEDDRTAVGCRILLESASVQHTSRSTPAFFGKEDVQPGTGFGELVEVWRRRAPRSPDEWIETLAQQVVDSCSRDAPQIREWATFRPADNPAEYVVALGRVKRRASCMVFDCYFYRLVDVQAVSSHMNRVRNMYFKDLDEAGVREMLLSDLIAEMVAQRRTRLPILEAGRPRYIIHGSTIDRLVRERAFDGVDVLELTLDDLLDHEFLEGAFATSFVCVDADTTIADATVKMNEREHCQDIFVTESGEPDDQVLGWLCDRDLIDPDSR